MFQNFDILNVEVCFGVTLEFLLWLTWVHSLKNANTAEILQAELQPTNCITSCKVLRCLALFTLFDLSSHFCLVYSLIIN